MFCEETTWTHVWCVCTGGCCPPLHTHTPTHSQGEADKRNDVCLRNAEGQVSLHRGFLHVSLPFRVTLSLVYRNMSMTKTCPVELRRSWAPPACGIIDSTEGDGLNPAVIWEESGLILDKPVLQMCSVWGGDNRDSSSDEQQQQRDYRLRLNLSAWWMWVSCGSCWCAHRVE